MRLLNDRVYKNAFSYEILCSALEPRKKYISCGAFEEAVLIIRYPYMKLYKKIIHRKQIPLIEEEIALKKASKVYTTEDGEKYRKGHILTPTNILFSKDGTYLIISYINGDILVYNTLKWAKKVEFNFKGKITSMSLKKNGEILFIYTSNWKIILVNTKTWKIKDERQLTVKNDGTAIITDDLTTIFSINDKKRVSAINFEDLTEIQKYKGHNSGINMIRLSPDEKILATCGNDTKLCLFDVKTGKLLSYLLGHGDEVHSFDFSKDGKFLVSSSEDETLRLWDTKTYKCVKILNSIPNCFTLNRYKQILLGGDVKGTVKTFKFY